VILESNLQAGAMVRAAELVAPFGPLGVTAVAHRLVFRREDRTLPQLQAFVSWITNEISSESGRPYP
jgi:LysR family glycine cleavage system transcriptional activator